MKGFLNVRYMADSMNIEPEKYIQDVWCQIWTFVQAVIQRTASSWFG